MGNIDNVISSIDNIGSQLNDNLQKNKDLNEKIFSLS